jgi:hypothetical protein
LVSKNPALSGIATGNYELTDHHVVLGEHSGNHFKIILRNMRAGHVKSDDVTSIIHQSMEGDGKVGLMTSDDVTAVGHQATEGFYKPTSYMTSDYGATSIKTSSDITIQDGSHMTSNDVVTCLPQAIEEIRDAGFINYFGPQRFGSSSTSSAPFSSLVSFAILKNELVSGCQIFRERGGKEWEEEKGREGELKLLEKTDCSDFVCMACSYNNDAEQLVAIH